MIWASNRGHASCCQLLIDHGANINARDLHGATALIYAAKYGCYHCLDILIQPRYHDDINNRIDLNIQDKWGMSALMYASREGYYDCVMKLLEMNVNLSLCDKSGRTALQYAKTEEIEEIIECCEMTSYPWLSPSPPPPPPSSYPY